MLRRRNPRRAEGAKETRSLKKARQAAPRITNGRRRLGKPRKGGSKRHQKMRMKIVTMKVQSPKFRNARVVAQAAPGVV